MTGVRRLPFVAVPSAPHLKPLSPGPSVVGRDPKEEVLTSRTVTRSIGSVWGREVRRKTLGQKILLPLIYDLGCVETKFPDER